MYTTQFSVYGDFMQSSTMTIRLDDTLKSQLEKLAESTHRTKSYLAAEAIQVYVTTQEWQINEINQGLQEAEAGDFIDHSEVVKRWESRSAYQMDKNRK